MMVEGRMNGREDDKDVKEVDDAGGLVWRNGVVER